MNVLSNLDVLRLVGGSYNEGRVEFYYKGVWGTICSVFWAINDARVVCRQLGFQDAEVAYKDAYFGEGTGPIWINSLNCRGYESLVTSCPQSRWYFQSNCNHSKDVGVRCKGIRGENKYWRLTFLYVNSAGLVNCVVIYRNFHREILHRRRYYDFFCKIV